MTHTLTAKERTEWLLANTQWREDLPEAERRKIEEFYDDDAIELAIASGFN